MINNWDFSEKGGAIHMNTLPKDILNLLLDAYFPPFCAYEPFSKMLCLLSPGYKVICLAR